jgi:hypothetical protein
MLYRATAIGVVAFWAVMMALLVRLETHPEQSDILDVPVSYVMRLMFRHGQQSFLTVSDGTRSIGSVNLRPSISGSETRTLDFSGTLSVPQRFNFSGTIDMDTALRMRDFKAEFSVREPPWHVNASGNAASNQLSYQVLLGTQQTAAQKLPMQASALIPALAQTAGLDPRALPIAAGITPPEISAREGQITLHGEQLQVYQVTVSESGAPVIDLYVSQLGQIVSATSTFGYTLSAEDWQ